MTTSIHDISRQPGDGGDGISRGGAGDGHGGGTDIRRGGATDIARTGQGLAHRELTRRGLARRGRAANLWLSQAGQTTTEYALVLLGAATVAMLLTAWAGQTNRIGSLFDAVLRSVGNLIS